MSAATLQITPPPTLEETAELKSAMMERLSRHIYAEFDKQFGAQIVRLELDVKRLTDQLSKAIRILAVRDAALAKVFHGERFPGGDPANPAFMNVFCRLPTGQVAISYAPAEFGLIDCVPMAKSSPWDGHSEEEAFQRLLDFARARENVNVTFTKLLEPVADLRGYFQGLDTEMGTR